MKYKDVMLGMRVKYVQTKLNRSDYSDFLNECAGIVKVISKHVPDDEGDTIGVEFENLVMILHDCDGKCKSGTGYYVNHHNLVCLSKNNYKYRNKVLKGATC